MTSLVFFYGRISTNKGQKLDRQIAMAEQLGIPESNRFMEVANGSFKHRPQLDRLLEVAREGDTVYVESLSRVSRDLSFMLELCKLFNDKGIVLISLKEGEVDASTASGKLWLSICGALSEWEKANLAQRRLEGQQTKREKTGKCGGRTPIDENIMKKAVEIWQSRTKGIDEICTELKINKSSFYRYVKANNLSRD